MPPATATEVPGVAELLSAAVDAVGGHARQLAVAAHAAGEPGFTYGLLLGRAEAAAGDAAAAEAAAAGCAKLHLEVRDGNPATRLYQRHGFAKMGERRGYYRGVGGLLHDAHSYGVALPLAY